jgi:hypothetical protein
MFETLFISALIVSNVVVCCCGVFTIVEIVKNEMKIIKEEKQLKSK